MQVMHLKPLAIESPEAIQTAQILERDLGLVAGAKYARRIAANDGPLSHQYQFAAWWLEDKAANTSARLP